MILIFNFLKNVINNVINQFKNEIINYYNYIHNFTLRNFEIIYSIVQI